MGFNVGGGVNNVVVKNNITISHTGTTDETILYSELIPAGTFQANDDLEIYLRFFGTNSVGLKELRLRFNNNNDLVGAFQLGRNQGTTSSAGGSILHRNLIFKNSLTSQEVLTQASSYSTDTAINSTQLNALNIDFTIDQYFIVTGQLADMTDAMGIRSIRAQILRK
jgi:hypothetical protein